MFQRIFNHRLQNKLRYQFLLHLLIDLPFHFKVIIMHDQLDFQISLNIPDAVLHSHHISTFTQSSPIKSRKSQRYTADLLLPAFNSHPVYNRKRIIQKMRIDLCSQSFQFKFLERDLILINFFDQPVDLIHHMMEAPYQLSHLVL